MTAKNTYLVVSDSFKGALSSAEAGQAIADGIRMACKEATVRVLPAADGGEGSAEALSTALVGQRRTASASDPFGFPIDAAYYDLGIIDGVRSAVFDMASCAGLGLAKRHGLDPLAATTFGVGEMIVQLRSRGFRRIYIGLGGSGTNDGGIGALSAMRARFFDKHGAEIHGVCGGMLSRIVDIDLSAVHALLSDVELCLLYDVALPLYGENGASRMFSPQKGADPETVEILERGMRQYAAVVSARYPVMDPLTDGAGAAGGLGFGLYAAGGRLLPGADTILRAIGYPDLLHDCALVFTGEGCTDRQTAHGKLPSVVTRYAYAAGVPCVDLCGQADILPEHALYDCGMTAVFPIVQGPMTLAESMACTAEALTKTAYNVVKLRRAPL